MAEPGREIAIRNAHRRLRVDRAAIQTAIAVLDRHASKFDGGCPPGELSLVFLTDRALAQVHADFMEDPSVTDVITFEGDPVAGLAGEICVSADTARRYVETSRTTRAAGKARASRPDAFSSELTLYLVHGWLHLAGYDDLQPVKKRRMRGAERRALALLQAADAVPRFRWR